MDQRWVELIQKIHREGFAEVVFRFPSQPRRAEGFVVLSPQPGTEVDELARRVAEFLRPTGHGCVCFPNAVSSSVRSAESDDSRLGAQGTEVKEV